MPKGASVILGPITARPQQKRGTLRRDDLGSPASHPFEQELDHLKLTKKHKK